MSACMPSLRRVASYDKLLSESKYPFILNPAISTPRPDEASIKEIKNTKAFTI